MNRDLLVTDVKLFIPYSDYILYYGGFMFMIPSIYTLYQLFKKYFLGDIEYSHNYELELFFLFTLLLSTISILEFYFQRKNLKFYKVNCKSKNVPDLNKIIDCIKKLKWQIQFKNDEKLIVDTKFESRFSWGEQVTILIDSNKILINCVSHPHKIPSFSGMIRAKKNLERLAKEILEIEKS